MRIYLNTRALLMCFVMAGFAAEGSEEVTNQENKKAGKPKVKNPYFTKFQEQAGLRPTKCQVCRLMVSEVLEKLRITDYKETFNKGYGFDLGEDPMLQIHYHKSELRLMEVLEDLCNRVKLYRARAGPEFPYIRGAKSHMREVMDNLDAKSKVKLNYQMPERVIEDYTHEVGRLKFKCVHMLEAYEEAIEEWYFENQDEDLMTWLCRRRVLNKEEQGCLTASTEMPADYYDAFKNENTRETKKPVIPMRDNLEDDDF